MFAIKTNFEVTSLSVENDLTDEYLQSIDTVRYTKVPAKKVMKYLSVTGVEITTEILDYLNGRLSGCESMEIESILQKSSSFMPEDFEEAMYWIKGFLGGYSHNEYV